MSVWDDELLSTPKVIKFLANSLPKLHEPVLPNVIPYELYIFISLYHIFLLY